MLKPALANNLRALRIVVALCLSTLPVPLVDGDWTAAIALAAFALVYALASSTASWLAPFEVSDRSRASITAEVAASWMVVSVASALVTLTLAHVAAGSAPGLQSVTGALFETVSGVTTTGLSVVGAPEAIGPTLQWWRSVMQLGGAIGVVVFGLIIAEESGDDNRFFNQQWESWSKQPPVAAARRIVTLLLGITAAGFVGLKLAGSTWWGALNHATTAASTGGFAITSDSASALTSPAKVVLIIAFVLPALSFATLWGAISGQGPVIWQRTQVRWTLGLTTLLAAVAVALSWGDASVLDAIFDAVSASTTTGFATGAMFQELPALAAVTTVSMFIGGAAGSTAGGVKVARVAWLARSVSRWLPTGAALDDRTYRWDGGDVEPSEAVRRIGGASALFTIFATATMVVAVVLMLTAGASFGDAVFEAVSALSNVGLTSGLSGPETDMGSAWVLTGAMLVGRVEITAFLALALVAVRR